MKRLTIGPVFALMLLLPTAAWGQSLVAAVLPSSRSVQVGVSATAFATIINTGSTTATGCQIAVTSGVAVNFIFQTTDPATNQVTGLPNTPVSIAAGANQSFVISLMPIAPFSTDVQFSFDCANTSPAPVVSGLNTLLLTASNAAPPDIVALAATLSADGIVTLPNNTGIGVFAVATVNVGIGATIVASADMGAANLPLSVFLCETNPSTGVCLSAIGPSVTTTIGAGATPTFGIFVQGLGSALDFDPANRRIFVRFRDIGGTTRGSTSVAVRAAAPAPAPSPDIRGTYRGSGTVTQTGCLNPANNGFFGLTLTLTIDNQAGSAFSGSGIAVLGTASDALAIVGSVSSTGGVSGSFSFNVFSGGFFVGSGDGTLSGQLSGNTLTLEFSGRFRTGELCAVSGVVLATR